MDAVRQLIAEIIEKRGLDLANVSRAIGMNHAYLHQFINRGVPMKLTERPRERLAEYFGLEPDVLKYEERAREHLGREPDMPSTAESREIAVKTGGKQKPLVNHAGDSLPSTAEGEPETNARLMGPFTGQLVDRRLPYIPVHGTAEAGPDGRFEMNTGDTIDHIPTPPKLANAKGLYAIYVDGDSMVDAFEPGDPAIVNPHIPPKIRDYVVIFLRHGHKEGAPKAYLKRLIRRTADKVIVEQLNPRKEMTFKMEDIQVMHRVYRPAELILV